MQTTLTNRHKKEKHDGIIEARKGVINARSVCQSRKFKKKKFKANINFENGRNVRKLLYL